MKQKDLRQLYIERVKTLLFELYWFESISFIKHSIKATCFLQVDFKKVTKLASKGNSTMMKSGPGSIIVRCLKEPRRRCSKTTCKEKWSRWPIRPELYPVSVV